MDEFFTVNHLKALKELILVKTKNPLSDNDSQQVNTFKLGHEDISSTKQSFLPSIELTEFSKHNGQNIWYLSEATILLNSDIKDSRKVPEYEIKFKQAVTTEDVYLGIGFKTPASASCEWLSIYIKLLGEAKKNIKLNVKSEFVDIRSPKYRLHLPISHVIDPNASSAKWHHNSSTLELTLRIIRELDAVNF